MVGPAFRAISRVSCRCGIAEPSNYNVILKFQIEKILVLLHRQESDWTAPLPPARLAQISLLCRIGETWLDNVYTCVYHQELGGMAELSFEWDEDKNAANIKNHGIDFLDAASIFENPTIEAIDDREDYGELRCVALG
jgi:hypothetical protein